MLSSERSPSLLPCPPQSAPIRIRRLLPEAYTLQSDTEQQCSQRQSLNVDHWFQGIFCTNGLNSMSSFLGTSHSV